MANIFKSGVTSSKAHHFAYLAASWLGGAWLVKKCWARGGWWRLIKFSSWMDECTNGMVINDNFWLKFKANSWKKCYQFRLHPGGQCLPSWWFQPNWKICSSTWESSPKRNEGKKCLKPPPSFFLTQGGFAHPLTNFSSVRSFWKETTAKRIAVVQQMPRPWTSWKKKFHQ